MINLYKLFLYNSYIIPFLLIFFLLKLHKNISKKGFKVSLLTLIFIVFITNLLMYKIYIIPNANNTNSSKEEIKSEEHNNEEIIINKPSVPSSNNKNQSSKNKEQIINGHTINIIDGVTYIDGYLIVNKTYSLPENFIPQNVYKSLNNTTEICKECINVEAYNAFTKMRDDAQTENLNLWIQSGYRSYSYQSKLYNNYVQKSGKSAADTFSARPGYSEHQSGLAFDLNTITDSFAATKEGIWVNQNCYKYGFIIRYPKNKDNETGYKYESWHLRYVGIDFATKLYNDGDWITLESYFGISSKYEN